MLFTALAFSAYDDRLRLPQILGVFGLALFAYVIGVGAGPSFFAALRTGGRALGVVVGALGVGAVVTVLAGNALGLSGPILSGVYAGALTNTPALAAASEAWASDLPTVGYSVTYLFGVLGMLLAAAIGIKAAAPHKAWRRSSRTRSPRVSTAPRFGSRRRDFPISGPSPSSTSTTSSSRGSCAATAPAIRALSMSPPTTRSRSRATS